MADLAVRQSHSSDQDAIECGNAARKHFPFADEYHNLNHGSFGATPKSVLDLQRTYHEATEARPDVFIRYDHPSLVSTSRTAISAYLNSPKSSLVYVTNATTGLNTVLRNLVFSPGDVAIYFSTIYAAIEKTLLYLTETTPLTVHRTEIVHPLSDDEVLSHFRTAIDTVRSQGKTVKIAVFDTISSVPGVLCPFPQLISLCRSEGILSVVDGAHGVGHIPLDLTALDPDFLITNLHKWLHVPRPCAILYVPERNQALMRSSLPTSHGFVPRDATGLNDPIPSAHGERASDFESNFTFTGTLASSPYLCAPAALQWRSRLTWKDKKGEDAVLAYNFWLAEQAGRLVSEALGTEVMENPGKTLGRCAFRNVRLPLKYEDLTVGEYDFGRVLGLARWMEKVLVDEYQTFIAIFWHGGAFWVRLSAQVYLTVEDWEAAGQWLKDVCERAKAQKKW